jgi:OFA family oxalate/formate antiporter-like MFS transporter
MLKAGGGRTVAATFVTLGLAYGVWYSFAVFLVALLRDFGWSRSVVAGAFSTFTLVHGLLAYPTGWLCDRIGPRRLVLAGGILLAAGLVLDGAVRQPWQLYLAFGVLTAFGVAAAGWVPAVILVQRWYPHRLGTVLGFTSAGIGVGIFIVVPLSQVLIDGVGWRDAFRTLGVVMAVWIVPAALWLVRDPPRPAAAPVGARAGGGDVSLRQALATHRFWLIAVAQGAASFVNQMLLAHQVAYLVDHGVTTFVAASVVGVVGLGSILGKAGGGWASDMFGRELTYTVGIALVAASIGTLGLVALSPAPVWAYLYGALVGVGYAVTAPLMPAVVSDLYRGRNFGAIFGAVQVANAVGGSAGPWVAGRIFDVRGSYTAAFVMALAAGAISTTALWWAAPRRGPDRRP